MCANLESWICEFNFQQRQGTCWAIVNWSWPKKKSGIGVHKLIFTEKQNKKRSTGRERALHLKKKKKLKRRQRINQQTFLQNPCKWGKSHHYHHQRKWEYSLSEMVCLQEIYLPNNIEWQIFCWLNTMRFFRKEFYFLSLTAHCPYIMFGLSVTEIFEIIWFHLKENLIHYCTIFLQNIFHAAEPFLTTMPLKIKCSWLMIHNSWIHFHRFILPPSPPPPKLSSLPLWEEEKTHTSKKYTCVYYIVWIYIYIYVS